VPTDDKLELLLVEFVNAHFYDGIRNAQGRIPRPAPAEAARAALLAHIAANYARFDADDAGDDSPKVPEGWEPNPAWNRSTGRERTLYADDAGQVVSGAPDFEGDEMPEVAIRRLRDSEGER